MNIIKPMQQGLMSRTFVKEKRFYLSVASLSFFPFENPTALGTEQEMWDTLSNTLDNETIFDECLPKVKGEVLMMGKCYASNQTPTERLFVDLDFGPIMKRVVVTGDRHWKRGETTEGLFGRVVGGDWEMSPPTPFLEMDLGWQNAFGGPDFPRNPLGKGYLPLNTAPNLDHTSMLPNVERPERMVAIPTTVAEPAGYGPVNFVWPQRAEKAGKQYDETWVKERYPEPAVDMDPAYYNAAPDDQQLKQGFFTGDETFEITHMHEKKAVLKGTLPKVRPRCFILQKRGDKERWREIPLKKETVWLFPNIERGILVSRGIIDIDTFYGVDVDTVLMAWELENGKRRDEAAYRQSVRLRQDDATAEEWVSIEDDLSPPEGIPDEPDVFETDEGDTNGAGTVPPAVSQGVDRAKGIMGRASEILSSFGLNPADYLSGADVAAAAPSTPPPLKKMSDISKLQKWMDSETKTAERALAKLGNESRIGNITSKAEGKKVADELARDICKRAGEDYDELKTASAKKAAAKPDKSMFERVKGLLKEAKEASQGDAGKTEALENAEKTLANAEEKLAAAESDSDVDAMTRDTAHMEEPVLPTPEAAAALREWAVSQFEAGASLAEKDLTGIDLSNLDLHDADFKGAMVDSVNFNGSDLSGANFCEATVARADFTGCALQNANFTNAGAGKGIFRDANLTCADLSGATLDYAVFNRANLLDATLHTELCQFADFSDASLQKCTLDQSQFLNTAFDRTNMTEASLVFTSFMECTMNEAVLERADLTDASFAQVTGENARFGEATMLRANAHLNTSFTGSDFHKIQGEELNFSETNLLRTNFSDALINHANFGMSSLNFAAMNRVRAVETDFTDADLSDADFEGANLMFTSLSGSIALRTRFVFTHLFGSDLLFARTEDADLNGAEIKRTALEEKG